jgi:hypothetical protein
MNAGRTENQDFLVINVLGCLLRHSALASSQCSLKNVSALVGLVILGPITPGSEDP